MAKRSRDGGQSRRLLALAEIYDGKRRSDAARLAGVGLQIVRLNACVQRVPRFNAEGPDGLIDRKAPGPSRKLTDEQRAALGAIVEAGPIPAVHGVVRWRRRDLAQWLWEEFGVSLDETTVGRELRRMGFAQALGPASSPCSERVRRRGVQKNFPERLSEIRNRLAPGVEIELWWQDEARVGRKNKITGRWAGRGTLPSAPQDQRTKRALARSLEPVAFAGWTAPAFPEAGCLEFYAATARVSSPA